MQLIECDARHAGEILAIFNEAIANSTALYDYKPRTAAMVQQWFEAKQRANLPVIGLIDEQQRLAGFASYGQFRPHAAYKYTLEHSIYVEPAQRGRGLGARLLSAIIDRAQQSEYHSLIGAIDAQNAVSIALHRRFGFELCGTVRQAGFKFGRWLDLQFYQLLLKTPAQPRDS